MMTSVAPEPRMPSPLHPELAGVARFLPRAAVRPGLLPFMRFLDRLVPEKRRIGTVSIETKRVPGHAGQPDVRVRVFRPEGLRASAPALVWIHGGGFVIGRAAADDGVCAEFATALECLVVSVDYRLAPDHPFPAPLEDCYGALAWTVREAATLGVDPARVAIGGESAGGGLTAQLALLARDRGELRPVFQLLVYPMLDDRSAVRTDVDETDFRLWNRASNVFGWRSYLGRDPGGDGVSDLAAPARRANLSGLPPAALSVGDLDLFHDEDVAYAKALQAAGVPCEVDVVPGAFHGFNRVLPKSDVARAFRAKQVEALRRAFSGG